MKPPVSGPNFAAGDFYVQFFAATAVRTREESDWSFILNDTEVATLYPATARSIFRELSERRVQEFVKSEGDVDKLNVDFIEAVWLYIAGMLTSDDLKQAVDHPGCLAVPNVQIDGRKIGMLRIFADSECKELNAA
jgi:hypothetical protein